MWKEADAQNHAKHNLAMPRTELSGYFNCHGLVFASRRAAITDISQIDRILKEDAYEGVEVGDVMPGDVAVYYKPDTGDAEHSAIVVSVPQPGDLLPAVFVVSKWGPCGREYYHRLEDCPYGGVIRYYRVKK